MKASLEGSGVTGSVSGTYTISDGKDGALKLKMRTRGCVNGIKGSCRSNTDTITLTPLD